MVPPLLYLVAPAGLSAPAIAAPIRHILGDQKNVTVLLAEATAIDAAKKEVCLDDGARIAVVPPARRGRQMPVVRIPPVAIGRKIRAEHVLGHRR